MARSRVVNQVHRDRIGGMVDLNIDWTAYAPFDPRAGTTTIAKIINN